MKVKDLMVRRLVSIDVDKNLSDAIRLMKKEKVSRLLVRDDDKIIGIITERDVMKRIGYWKERKILTTHIHVSSAYTKDLKVIDENEDIKKAAKIMLEKNVSSLVVKKGEEIAGIIAKTDLIKLLKENKTLIKDVMRKPVTIQSDSTLLQARKIMLERGIKKLIVTSGNTLVGVITEGDVGRALAKFREVTEGTHIEKRMKDIKVGDVMTRNPIKLGMNSTVGDAVTLMLKNDIGCLPVVDNEKIVGMVTKTDLIKMLI